MNTAAPPDLSGVLRRRWTRGEQRVLLVLLTGARLLTRERIEQVARSRPGTVNLVLMVLETSELAYRSQLGHYYLTVAGRAFCLQVMGLE